MKDELTAHQWRLWRISGGLAPVILLAAKCTWVEAMGAALLCAIMQSALERMPEGKPTWLRWLPAELGILQGLSLLQDFWQWEEPGIWPGVILLVLAIWGGSKAGIHQGSIVLLWLTGILLASVLLSAVPEIRIRNLRTDVWSLERPAALLGVLLLTGMGGRQGRRETGRERSLPWLELGAVAVITSLCVQGTLSTEVLREPGDPFYEVSRSVRFLGSLKRFESLAILGILLGMWLWFTCLLRLLWERKEEKREGWLLGGICLTVGIWVLKIDYEIWLLGSIVLSEYATAAIRRIQKTKEK